MVNIAFITGITGQDGSYLTELLLCKGYEIHGIIRRTSLMFSTKRIDHVRDKINLHYGDLTDSSSIYNLITKILNNRSINRLEIYNLGAQSHVQISFEIPEYTSMVDGIGVLKLLEVIKSLPKDIQDKTRFYQAGTSEMFGDIMESVQNESTPFRPQSSYACAKDYVYGMWLMLQQDKPDDYVLATNVTTSIKDFIIMCFKYKNIELEWKGSGLDEIAINKENGEKVVEIDSKYFRPSEVNYLLGSAMKAKKELGWVPKYNLDSMIKDMFEY